MLFTGLWWPVETGMALLKDGVDDEADLRVISLDGQDPAVWQVDVREFFAGLLPFVHGCKVVPLPRRA